MLRRKMTTRNVPCADQVWFNQRGGHADILTAQSVPAQIDRPVHIGPVRGHCDFLHFNRLLS